MLVEASERRSISATCEGLNVLNVAAEMVVPALDDKVAGVVVFIETSEGEMFRLKL